LFSSSVVVALIEKYSTSKPSNVSPEKSHILSCDTVVAHERYVACRPIRMHVRNICMCVFVCVWCVFVFVCVCVCGVCMCVEVPCSAALGFNPGASQPEVEKSVWMFG
jgi:hypothetical protein